MSSASQKVRIAFFGSRSSGKTSLLSSYFGHMQRPSWERERQYRISTSVADSNLLLRNFYRMQKGSFPEATVGRELPYVFSMWISGCRQPAFDIEWIDYPGEWWEKVPEDEAKKDAREICLQKLTQSHVGFLVIDGYHYRTEGRAYLGALLSQFNNVVRNLLQPEHGTTSVVTTFGVADWIILLTKADLMPEDYTAEQLATECLELAEEINGLGDTLSSRRFGDRYLLVSAALGEEDRVIDVEKSIGLDLIAPCALLSVAEHVVAEAKAKVPTDPRPWWLRVARAVVEVLDKADDFLPKKYQVLTGLLRIFGANEAIAQTEKGYRDRQASLAAQGRAMEAGVAAMKADLQRASASRYFFQTQRQEGA